MATTPIRYLLYEARILHIYNVDNNCHTSNLGARIQLDMTCVVRLSLTKDEMFLWSIIQKAIFLGETLKHMDIVSDISCPRCKVLGFIIALLPQKMWLNALPRSSQSCRRWCRIDARKTIFLPPTGVTSNIFPWICWVIWTAQNKLVFEDWNTSPKEVGQKNHVSRGMKLNPRANNKES